MVPTWVRWLATCTGFLLVAACTRRPVPPLATSFWYWHKPTVLAADQTEDLQAMRVETLYVLAATIAQEEGHLSVVLPQRFEKGRHRVHLVFRLDATIAAEFESMDLDLLASKIIDAYERVGTQAKTQGWTVEGIQLDFDCPTRLLERYAKLVQQVRDRAPKRTALSLTGLGSWYDSPAIEFLAKACDEVVPQCYEAGLGGTLDRLQPVSNLSLLQRTVERAERLGRPYRIGIPAYGHALLYDPAGKLATTFRRMGPRTIARHPSFVLERAFPMNSQGRPAIDERDWIGEDLLVYRAVKPARDGQGLGFRVAFKIPTPRVVDRALQRIRSLRPRHCRGIVVFRIAEPGEELAVPLGSIASVFQGADPQPKVQLSADHKTIPYPGIESPDRAQPLPVMLTIRVANGGRGPTAIRPDAVILDLAFDAPGNTLTGGDFVLDAATGPTGVASTLMRATRLRVRSAGLLPGESAKVELRIEGPARRVRIAARALLPGGFRTLEHELNVEDLREESRKPQ